MRDSDSLAGLLAHLDERARARDRMAEAAGLPSSAFPAMPALDGFRQLWERLHGEDRLRTAMRPPPPDAGPLNSASLAHRSLALMQATSPGYLDHFLAWLDTLSWLEQMQADSGLGGSPQPTSATAGSRRKRSRGR